MNLNRLAIISLTTAIIFVLPLFAVAQNGKPFQALQEQIDDLQQQLEAVQTGPVKAYVTKNGAIDLNLSNAEVSCDINEEWDVLFDDDWLGTSKKIFRITQINKISNIDLNRSSLS